MTPTTPECWLPVVGYEGYYEVSDLGRVRSLDRRVSSGPGRTRLAKGCILRTASTKEGRRTVCLQRESTARTRAIATLVLTAFVGPRPDGMEACHNDGDPSRDLLRNLRWDSKAGNARDRLLHGRDWQRNKTHCPQGHVLAAPNLVPSRAAQGMRMCRACQRARALRQQATRRGDATFDLTAAFADQYAQVMGVCA